MNDNSLIMERKSPVQKRPYAFTPDYYKHQAHEDNLAILVCQIKIWKAEKNDWFKIPSIDGDVTVIRECETIEITESAKDLVNKAILRFPRGTVIHVSSKKNKTVQLGDKYDNTSSSASLREASNDGEIITPDTNVFKQDGTSTTPLSVNYDDKGLIDFNRTKTEPALLSKDDVAIGNRIEIRLGYAYSESEFNKLNTQDNKEDSPLDLVFTGFITSVSVSTPLEIECTNMAHLLTTISTPNISDKAILTVKDFLDDDGKYHLLKGTGIKLADYCRKSEISVSGGSITNNMTVADVLAAWQKAGVLCLLDTKKNGSVELRVGLTYYAGKDGGDLPNNNKKYVTYKSDDKTVTIIQFDWDVADDNLKHKNVDKKYLAVEAQGRISNGSYIKFTIRKNPDLDDEGWMSDASGQWQVVNKRTINKKKKSKFPNGTNNSSQNTDHITDKVGLKKYSVISYISPKIGITTDELIEEAKQYWAKYNPNGITGTLSIFGDLFIKPTDIVGLIDTLHPEKNGYYYVESVKTNFGVGGYRRELTIPFKVASYTKPVTII